MPKASPERRAHLLEATWQNSGKACEAPGCAQRRVALGQWCNRHRLRAAKHGAPTALAIKQERLRPYRKQARRFLKANATHPFVVAASGWLDGLLTEAAARTAYRPLSKPAPIRSVTAIHLRRCRELARLKVGGVTGLEVLTAVLAVHLLSHFQSHRLAPFSEPYWFAVSRAVLKLRTLHRHEVFNFETGKRGRKDCERLSTILLRDLGRELTTALCVFLRAVTDVIDRKSAITASPQPAYRPPSTPKEPQSP